MSSKEVSLQEEEYRDDDDDDLQISSQPDNDISDISVVSDVSDDYEVQSQGKRKSKAGKRKDLEKPKKKLKKNRFVDEEAEEASEDEEDVDDDVKKKPEMKDKEYDKQFNQMLQRRQGKDVIKNIEERYKDLGEGEGEGEAQELYEADGLDSNDDDIEPPKLDDPKVWRVNCARGKEQDSAMSIMFKYSNHKQYDQPLEIVSAFALKKFPGAVFVEANFDWQVQRAVEGLYDLRQQGIEIVEPEQCITLFAPIEQETIPIEPGQWVRIKRHQLYEGDLGRVLFVDEPKRSLQIKLIPREKREISSFMERETAPTTKTSKSKDTKSPTAQFTMKGEFEQEEKPVDNKSSRWHFRTKYMMDQKRFVRGPKMQIKYDKNNVDSQREEQSVFYYPNVAMEKDRCRKDGFVTLHTSLSNILWKNIKPNLDELAYFYPDLKNIRLVLPKLQKSLRAALGSKTNFQVGDKVAIDKEHPGIRFTVKEILPDGKLLLTHIAKDKNTYEQKVYEHLADADSVKAVFMKYQNVTVISGSNIGIQGIIIDLKKNTAVLSTDSGKAIECLLNDLQGQRKIQGYDQTINTDPYKAQLIIQQTETQGTDKNIGGVTRNDLIKFGTADTDIGCVLSLQKDDMTILDLTNKMRQVNLMTITAKLNTRNNVAKNMHRHEIRKGDLIVILDGFYKGCKATIVHVYRDCLFLHSGKFDHTQGIIVEKVNNCALISSVSSGFDGKGSKRPQNSKSSQDTTNSTQAVVTGQELIGQTLTIARGQWAGYRGMVVTMGAKTISIQLTAKNLTVKVLKEEIQPSSGTSTQHSLHPGQTPHYAPQQSVRIWGEDMDNQKQQMQGYQSPYVYGQTPMHDYQQ